MIWAFTILAQEGRGGGLDWRPQGPGEEMLGGVHIFTYMYNVTRTHLCSRYRVHFLNCNLSVYSLKAENPLPGVSLSEGLRPQTDLPSWRESLWGLSCLMQWLRIWENTKKTPFFSPGQVGGW